MTASNLNKSPRRNRNRNRDRDQKGMATWVKILIGVIIVGTISIVGLIAAGVYFAGDTMKSMMDPAKIKTTAQSIAKFEDPLPEGWKFEMGLDLSAIGTSVVVVNNKKEDVLVTLLKLPRTKESVTSDKVIEEYSQKGVPNVSGMDTERSSAPINIKDRGKLTVGGEEMAYAVGESERRNKKFSQLIGCILPKDSANVIVVSGICQDASSYKLESTKTLLSAIKGF